MPQPFIYAQLSAESKTKLEQILEYKYSQHHGNWMTIDWDLPFDLYKDIIGKKFTLTVDTLAFDERMEAIPVNLEGTGLRSINKYPHISWSVVPEFKPFYANYLLFVPHEEKKFGPQEIQVEVLADYF